MEEPVLGNRVDDAPSAKRPELIPRPSSSDPTRIWRSAGWMAATTPFGSLPSQWAGTMAKLPSRYGLRRLCAVFSLGIISAAMPSATPSSQS